MIEINICQNILLRIPVLSKLCGFRFFVLVFVFADEHLAELFTFL